MAKLAALCLLTFVLSVARGSYVIRDQQIAQYNNGLEIVRNHTATIDFFDCGKPGGEVALIILETANGPVELEVICTPTRVEYKLTLIEVAPQIMMTFTYTSCVVKKTNFLRDLVRDATIQNGTAIPQFLPVAQPGLAGGGGGTVDGDGGTLTEPLSAAETIDRHHNLFTARQHAHMMSQARAFDAQGCNEGEPISGPDSQHYHHQDGLRKQMGAEFGEHARSLLSQTGHGSDQTTVSAASSGEASPEYPGWQDHDMQAESPHYRYHPMSMPLHMIKRMHIRDGRLMLEGDSEVRHDLDTDLHHVPHAERFDMRKPGWRRHHKRKHLAAQRHHELHAQNGELHQLMSDSMERYDTILENLAEQEKMLRDDHVSQKRYKTQHEHKKTAMARRQRQTEDHMPNNPIWDAGLATFQPGAAMDRMNPRLEDKRWAAFETIKAYRAAQNPPIDDAVFPIQLVKDWIFQTNAFAGDRSYDNLQLATQVHRDFFNGPICERVQEDTTGCPRRSVPRRFHDYYQQTGLASLADTIYSDTTGYPGPSPRIEDDYPLSMPTSMCEVLPWDDTPGAITESSPNGRPEDTLGYGCRPAGTRDWTVLTCTSQSTHELCNPDGTTLSTPGAKLASDMQIMEAFFEIGGNEEQFWGSGKESADNPVNDGLEGCYTGANRIDALFCDKIVEIRKNLVSIRFTDNKGHVQPDQTPTYRNLQAMYYEATEYWDGKTLRSDDGAQTCHELFDECNAVLGTTCFQDLTNCLANAPPPFAKKFVKSKYGCPCLPETRKSLRTTPLNPWEMISPNERGNPDASPFALGTVQKCVMSGTFWTCAPLITPVQVRDRAPRGTIEKCLDNYNFATGLESFAGTAVSSPKNLATGAGIVVGAAILATACPACAVGAAVIGALFGKSCKTEIDIVVRDNNGVTERDNAEAGLNAIALANSLEVTLANQQEAIRQAGLVFEAASTAVGIQRNITGLQELELANSMALLGDLGKNAENTRKRTEAQVEALERSNEIIGDIWGEFQGQVNQSRAELAQLQDWLVGEFNATAAFVEVQRNVMDRIRDGITTVYQATRNMKQLQFKLFQMANDLISGRPEYRRLVGNLQDLARRAEVDFGLCPLLSDGPDENYEYGIPKQYPTLDQRIVRVERTFVYATTPGMTGDPATSSWVHQYLWQLNCDAEFMINYPFASVEVEDLHLILGPGGCILGTTSEGRRCACRVVQEHRRCHSTLGTVATLARLEQPDEYSVNVVFNGTSEHTHLCTDASEAVQLVDGADMDLVTNLTSALSAACMLPDVENGELVLRDRETNEVLQQLPAGFLVYSAGNRGEVTAVRSRPNATQCRGDQVNMERVFLETDEFTLPHVLQQFWTSAFELRLGSQYLRTLEDVITGKMPRLGWTIRTYLFGSPDRDGTVFSTSPSLFGNGSVSSLTGRPRRAQRVLDHNMEQLTHTLAHEPVVEKTVGGDVVDQLQSFNQPRRCKDIGFAATSNESAPIFSLDLESVRSNITVRFRNTDELNGGASILNRAFVERSYLEQDTTTVNDQLSVLKRQWYWFGYLKCAFGPGGCKEPGPLSVRDAQKVRFLYDIRDRDISATPSVATRRGKLNYVHLRNVFLDGEGNTLDDPAPGANRLVTEFWENNRDFEADVKPLERIPIEAVITQMGYTPNLPISRRIGFDPLEGLVNPESVRTLLTSTRMRYRDPRAGGESVADRPTRLDLTRAELTQEEFDAGWRTAERLQCDKQARDYNEVCAILEHWRVITDPSEYGGETNPDRWDRLILESNSREVQTVTINIPDTLVAKMVDTRSPCPTAPTVRFPGTPSMMLEFDRPGVRTPVEFVVRMESAAWTSAEGDRCSFASTGHELVIPSSLPALDAQAVANGAQTLIRSKLESCAPSSIRLMRRFEAGSTAGDGGGRDLTCWTWSRRTPPSNSTANSGRVSSFVQAKVEYDDRTAVQLASVSMRIADAIQEINNEIVRRVQEIPNLTQAQLDSVGKYLHEVTNGSALLAGPDAGGAGNLTDLSGRVGDSAWDPATFANDTTIDDELAAGGESNITVADRVFTELEAQVAEAERLNEERLKGFREAVGQAAAQRSLLTSSVSETNLRLAQFEELNFTTQAYAPAFAITNSSAFDELSPKVKRCLVEMGFVFQVKGVEWSRRMDLLLREKRRLYLAGQLDCTTSGFFGALNDLCFREGTGEVRQVLWYLIWIPIIFGMYMFLAFIFSLGAFKCKEGSKFLCCHRWGKATTTFRVAKIEDQYTDASGGYEQLEEVEEAAARRRRRRRRRRQDDNIQYEGVAQDDRLIELDEVRSVADQETLELADL